MKNNAMITKADKGNTMIIISKGKYHEKTQNFINKNNFTMITQDLTTNFQTEIRNTINNCNRLICKEDKWKLINLNLNSPNILSLI